MIGFYIAKTIDHNPQELGSLVPLVMAVVCFLSLCALICSIFSYGYFRQKWAERKVLKDLKFMAEKSGRFSWEHIKLRASDCIYRFHAPWREKDEQDIELWMTTSYWQKYKGPFLEKLKNEDLINICNIKDIMQLRPIYFLHRNVGGRDEKSTIVLSVIARVQNYLAASSSGELIEGSKDFQDIQTVWCLELVNGVWLIEDVQESDVISNYINKIRELPEIEETLLKPVKVMSPAE